MTCRNAMHVEEMSTQAKCPKVSRVPSVKARGSGDVKVAREDLRSTSVPHAATRASNYDRILKKFLARSFSESAKDTNASTSSFSTAICFEITERSFFVSSGAMLFISPVL